MTLRLLITGSRDWPDDRSLHSLLSMIYFASGKDMIIVHGDCPTGADHQAEIWATHNGIETEKHPANWSQYGRSAGPRRNQEMVDTKPDMCLAFIYKRSKGATGCAAMAEKARIPTFTYDKE